MLANRAGCIYLTMLDGFYSLIFRDIFISFLLLKINRLHREVSADTGRHSIHVGADIVPLMPTLFLLANYKPLLSWTARPAHCISREKVA